MYEPLGRRLHEARPLQIGVPHPWQFPETLSEARRAFTELRARTLVSAGAHRCANSEESGCSGDDACGPAPAISDMAYSHDTIFQVAHELFSDSYEQDVVVALEGTARPGICISEGVVGELQPGGPAITMLDVLLTGGEQAVTCAAADVDSSPECGVDNVQGLYINGSAAACGPASPAAAAGRFVHLAQSADVAGDAESVLAALEAAVSSLE